MKINFLKFIVFLIIIVFISSLNAKTKTERRTYEFDYQNGAKEEFFWPNGINAVIFKVDHKSISGDYGLWISFYVFHEQGRGNYYRGSNDIKVGDGYSGRLLWRPGDWETFYCDDITLKIMLHKGVRYHKKGSKGFKYNPGWTGRVSLILELDVEEDN